MYPVICLIAAAAVLAACTSVTPTPDGSVPAPDELAGRTFLSTSVAMGGNQFALLPDTRVRLSFHDGEGLTADARCNSITSRYSLPDGRLTLDDLARTLIGCSRAQEAQDQWLTGFLAWSPNLGLDGDRLTLGSDATVIVLQDQGDAPLLGTAWSARKISVEGADLAMPQRRMLPQLSLSDDAFEITTACHWARSDLEIDEAVLRPEPFERHPHPDCNDPVGEYEDAVFAAFRSAELAYTLHRRTLTIAGGGFEIRFTASD